jgi:hypothetical protein
MMLLLGGDVAAWDRLRRSALRHAARAHYVAPQASMVTYLRRLSFVVCNGAGVLSAFVASGAEGPTQLFSCCTIRSGGLSGRH